MTADSPAPPAAVLAAWERGGTEALGEVMSLVSPEDQTRLAIDRFNRGEVEVLVALFSEDFVLDMRPTGIPGMGVYHGRAGYRRFLGEWLEAFPESHLSAESLEHGGDRQLAVIRQDVRGAGGGVPITFRYAAITTHRDGRAVASEFDIDLPRARARFRALVHAEDASPAAPADLDPPR